MIRREQRYKYAQPTADDRESWLTRVIWAREEHPMLERIMIGVVVIAAAIEVTFQIWVHLARAAEIAARAQGL